MSFSELIIILIVIVLVIKPEDLPSIFKQIRKFRSYFTDTKNEILSQMNISLDGNELGQNQDEINDYLKKISDMGSHYNGEYDLDKIRKHYENLLEEKITTTIISENKPT